MFLADLMFIPAPDNSYLNHVVLRAWKANLDSWTLTELDPKVVHCYTGVSSADDGRRRPRLML